ncbi:response regulator [Pseudanabaena sp. FACHB-2040]|uniref:response regulator n=1 Tax=Pseudanabaena sp. FACHB-2040 TaxID=2692859 RepID=UPI0016849EC9|nr:response regulator [Pseudanabaena sp. FACHB-2040]MBD2259076.1 response regulator [Pseudanabaena sp. FACHB-2040]
MQGHLSEIDIRSILQLIELGQRTGELYVEAHPLQSIGRSGAWGPAAEAAPSWLVFLANGQIVYAGASDGQLTRLRDHLHRYGLDQTLDTAEVSAIASFNSPEYGYLWTLLESHVLTPDQGRAILKHMVHETLFDLLSLHQGSFVFKLSSALSPQLTTLEIGPLVAGITKQTQEWKQFHPLIQSPLQCPVIPDLEAFRTNVSKSTYSRWANWMNGHTSLRQLSRYLNRDLITVVKGIYPYLLRGLVQLTHAPSQPDQHSINTLEQWQMGRVPRIVCVDDGIVVRQKVEQILEAQGYEATSIGNPLKALSLLFQLQPDLILCDIAMPELEGYELCAMLRSSNAFRQTPIVMLTGKDGFLDRVKARMAGATDYLTKPFGPGELLALVEKYVGPGDLQRPRPDTLLAEAIQDELDRDLSGTGSKPGGF